MLGPPLEAHHSQMVAATHSHTLGEWNLLGVGAPSQAPVPLHFQGHHLRSLTIAKSSSAPLHWWGSDPRATGPLP